MLKKETKSSLFLMFVVNALMFTMVSAIGLAQDGEAFDLSRYDAESKLIAFIPDGDSALKYEKVQGMPTKQFMMSFDGPDVTAPKSRINFKIGEWNLLEDKTEIDSVILDDDTKIVKSTYYLETDLIVWTDLTYEDVFLPDGGDYLTEEEWEWLTIKKMWSEGAGL